MAGIGIKLNKIFDRKTIGMNLVGYAYSINSTILPMLMVMGVLLLMTVVFGVSTVGYYDRELFSCTVLYMFIFSVLTVSPINAVISRYMSDVIFEERYDDIRPCFTLGLLIVACLAALLGVPFCLWEHFVGGVGVWYVFSGYFGYASLVLVLYTMIFLSICKDYSKISLFYSIGMLTAFVVSAILIYFVGYDKMHSMLIGLSLGFALIATLEIAQVNRYFPTNSRRYRPFLSYLRDHWPLVAGNFLYTLGLFIHNFVFWHTDMRTEVAHTFVCNQPYDMATCLALFTSLSASTIFISLMEMHFSERYRGYFNAVIGGSLAEINKAKQRMFTQLNDELLGLARIQFIVSLMIFLLFSAVAPSLGFTALEMDIYRLLAAAYFVTFLMYANIILLYYFSDNTGLLLSTSVFCFGTLFGSLWSSTLPSRWFGLGMWIGALAGWIVSYLRLLWVERHLDAHVFCQGKLIAQGKGEMPSPVVYSRPSGSPKVGSGPCKRVLFVINTTGRGGAETSLLALLRKLIERPDLDLSLFVLTGQGELIASVPPGVRLVNGERYSRQSVLSKEGRRELARTVLLAGLRHFSAVKNIPYLVRNHAAMRRAGRVQWDKLAWRVLADGAKRPRKGEEYDLAVAYIEGGSTYYVADHVKARRKAAFVHIDYAGAGYTRSLDQGCYDRIDHVFAVSPDVMQSFVAYYPEYAQKVSVHENIVDVQEIRRRSLLPGGFTDAYAGKRVLTVARLVPEKGIDLAIDALRILRDRGLEVRWYVLGDGELRTRLERRISQQGLDGAFILCGTTDNPYPFMRQADVYAHASGVEGKSVSIREAKALGKPIVVSGIRGNRELIEDGVDGLLCDLSAEDLADKVQSLLADPAYAACLGEAARQSSEAEEAGFSEGFRGLLRLMYGEQAPEGEEDFQ
jgi:uncharacterized membrane protein/glycosyltransferase involved in cell wall biosynthesis